MKKVITLLTICLLGVNAWGDVSVEERFALIASGDNSTAKKYNGDLCTWNILANRRTQDTIKINGTKYQCWWLNRADVNQDGSYMQTVNWEGGIKNVAFRCAQFGAEANNTLKLSFSVGEESNEYTITNSPDKNNGGETANFNFSQKSGQLVIRNISTGTGTGSATRRILVHYISITPYLLYPRHNKYITLGLKQKGFVNYLINNTGGNVTYESSNTSAATVDANGVITPVGVGTTTITASWEGCSTTYSLTIIDEVIVENFSQIGRVNGSITEEPASWSGDISNWNVRYVRRGVNDSVAGSFTPRKQATWLTRPATTKTGYIEMPAVVEGGVKHVKIPWQQWATESGRLKLVLYSAIEGGSWTAKKSQDVAAANKGDNFTFDEDIDTDGSLGNVRVKISNESYNGENPTTARLIIENIQITPWLLYTNKKCTLNMRTLPATTTFTNEDFINNSGTTPTYSIISSDPASLAEKVSVADNVVSVSDVTASGDVTVQASYSNVTTTYTLHILGKSLAEASFDEAEINKTFGDGTFTNALTKADGTEAATYESSNTEVATVVPSGEGAGTVTILAGGDAIIMATIPENANFKGETISYTLHVAKQDISASFEKETILLNSGDDVPANALSYTPNPGYDGQITYMSSNSAVATVENNVVTLAGGLGQTTITANLGETAQYGSTTASYILCVTESITEEFSHYATSWTTAASGDWVGDVCQWNVHTVRRKAADNTDKIGSELSNWLRYDKKNDDRSYLTTTDLEGGIKAVSFKYARYGSESGSGVSDRTLKLTITAGAETPHEVSHADNSLADKNTGIGYSHLFNCKSNGQLRIENTSTATNNNDNNKDNLCRILVGNVTITPYICYTKKFATVGVGGTFTNTALINNTAGEGGSLTYESSNPSVASVEGGEVIGVSEGTATIIAKYSWSVDEYVTTSYSIRVVESTSLVEDYSKTPEADRASATYARKSYEGNCGIVYYRNIRIYGDNDKLNDGTKGFWMNHTYNTEHNSSNSCYIDLGENENLLEGGIKNVSFKWHQFGNAKPTDKPQEHICLSIKINNTEKEQINADGQDAAGTLATTDQSYNSGVNVYSKANAKLTIANISYQKGDPTKDAQGRVIIGPIRITPYLFYLNREVTITKNKAYVHPLLDNTENEGAITYTLVSPSPSDMATINARTGEVIATKNGTVTVKATWSEGAYTTYTLHVGNALKLFDTADNGPILTAYNRQTVDVQLADRTIRTGGYNTLCLPFAMSEAKIDEALPGAKVYNFTNAYLSTDNLDIRFEKVNSMEAGKPYLVTVPADVPNPVFEGVTISNVAAQTVESENAILNFIGTYEQTTMPSSALYVVGDALRRNTANVAINAFRAYFDVPADSPASAPSVRMRIVTHTDHATGMEQINQAPQTNVQKVIRDGQLYIIYEGRMYDVRGIRVK